MTGITKWVKVIVQLIKESSYHAQDGVNESSVRTEGPLCSVLNIELLRHFILFIRFWIIP